MAVRQPEAWSGLRAQELVERDGIYHRADEHALSDYRRRWEDEAAEDHVRSAIATGTTVTLDYETLTEKSLRSGTGSLAAARSGRCSRSAPATAGSALPRPRARRDLVDLLRRRHLRDDAAAVLEYREQFAPAPASRLYPVCALADALPPEDDSVDLAVTSAVFLHMGKSFVADAVREIARTLKPGGHFVFDVSFPNAHNPTNLLLRLKPERLRPPHFMKFWTRAEVERLLHDTGLAAKAGAVTVEPGAHAILPKRVGPVPIPLARQANRLVGSAPNGLDGVSPSRTSPTAPGCWREGARYRRRRLPRLAACRAARGRRP